MNPKKKKYLIVSTLALIGLIAWVVFSFEIETPLPEIFWQATLLVVSAGILAMFYLPKERKEMNKKAVEELSK